MGQDVLSRENSMSKGGLEAKREHKEEDDEPFLKQEGRVGVLEGRPGVGNVWSRAM